MSLSGKKKKLDRSAQDNVYFESYSDVTIHEEMIADKVRTNAYRLGILKNYKAIKGKVVLDVGAGTCVLSIFCVHAGAKKVYAVEASAIAEQAKEIVKLNKMEDKITIIKGTLETAELPENVDVIVSEWMGYALLHESMLNSVLFARDKWLKPGGLMLPSVAALYIAPINEPVAEDRLNFWSTVKDQYGVDMTCMYDFARKCIMMTSEIAVNSVTMEDVLSHPAKFAELDLHTVTTEQLESVKGSFNCECFGSSSVNALCIWFSVTFPGDDKPLVLCTSPFNQETHWKQSILYLDEAFEVAQDTKVAGEITMSPSVKNPRHVCVHLDYSIGEHTNKSKTFSMGDGFPDSE
ncbi:ANM6 methyltransferase, partial [Polyodon spathula]|nr:ANM6 methyltransferase [Polyodon spathula]